MHVQTLSNLWWSSSQENTYESYWNISIFNYILIYFVKQYLISSFLLPDSYLIFGGMIVFVVLFYPFCVAVKLMSTFGKVFE